MSGDQADRGERIEREPDEVHDATARPSERGGAVIWTVDFPHDLSFSNGDSFRVRYPEGEPRSSLEGGVPDALPVEVLVWRSERGEVASPEQRYRWAEAVADDLEEKHGPWNPNVDAPIEAHAAGHLRRLADDCRRLREIEEAAREAKNRLRILRTNRGMTVMEATGAKSPVRKEWKKWDKETGEILDRLHTALEADTGGRDDER